MEERWSSLDYLGLSNYKVSTLGRVFNIKTGEQLNGSIDTKGYIIIGFRLPNKKRVNHSIHKLVAHSFIPYEGINKPSFKYIKSIDITVDHIDRNRTNNVVSNLRWATRKIQRENQTSDRKKLKCKRVLQYDLNGNLLKIWNSAMEAAESTGFDESSIRYCCRGVYLTSNGFNWEYEKEEENDLYDNEEWKTVYNEKYGEFRVSSMGRIKTQAGNITLGRFCCGYLVVYFKDKNDKEYAKTVHRLIAAAFLGDVKGFIVNHKNGNKEDNRKENLEITTQKKNVQHAYETGLIDVSKQYKSVIRINPTTNKITGYYESIKQASEMNNVPHGNIIKVCKGERNICGGYNWVYGDDPAIQEELKLFKENKKTPEIQETVNKRKRTRSVFQIDPDSNVILGYYLSIEEAAKKTNIGASNISCVCRNITNTAGKFKWCYADTPELENVLKEYLAVFPYKS